MYRLHKIYATDITAGKNLLRNGFVPIFRENGKADHGVLFAVNGTCKTTLLSFILNVFCPDQRRFVQHLQSGGDKTLEQYLIPGRPALVLLDMVAILQQTLFEREPMEHLVLGQLLYRHRSAPDKMERTFFIAQSADFFNVLRREWNDLLRHEQPFKTVRDFMAPHIQQTTSQKEWADNLERLGLDPWLIDRQIDFARTEGGIKDTFKFRSESEFLSFFLGCVVDMDAAATIRDTIGQSLRKMEDRPRKIARLQVARDLKEQISNFDDIARQWRNACDAVASWHAKLGEAAYLLNETDKVTAEKIGRLNLSIAEAETQRDLALSRLETTGANILAVRHFKLAKSIETAEANILSTHEEKSRLEAEIQALKAAGHKSEIQKKRAEAEIKKEALLQADSNLAPLLLKIERLAAQYHVRLDEDKRQILEKIETLQIQKREAEKVEKTIEHSLKTSTTQHEALNQKMARIMSGIQAADAGRTALRMEPGESPLNTQERLKEDVDNIKNRITDTESRIAALEEEMQVCNLNWQKLQIDRSDLDACLKLAKDRVEAEARERSHLLADPYLIRMAGTPGFEPTSAELISRLDDALARCQDRFEEKQRTHLALKADLDRLSRTESLAADDQTQRLIIHYYQKGVSPGELKSFPEYLANLYQTPEEIAVFIEADPARFTGIMAATAAVIETIRNLPVPEWLCRPVVISIPCPPEAVSPINQTIIRPDPEIYSKRHMTDTKAQLHKELEILSQIIAREVADFRKMERSSHNLHSYRETYPDRTAVDVQTNRVRQMESNVSALALKISEAEDLMKSLRERKSEQERLCRSLTVNLTRQTEWLHQVEKWLNLYMELETWQQEHEKMLSLKAELDKSIASDSETLRKIREDIGRIMGDIRVQETQLKGLDERACEVPYPQGDPLFLTDLEAALAMNLQSLKSLYESAREDQRQMTSTLGIDILQKETTDLELTLARQEALFEAFRRDHPYDENLADSWTSRNPSEREDRKETLDANIQKLRESMIRLESDINYQSKDIEKLEDKLSAIAKNGIIPDVAENDLNSQDPDILLERLQNEEARHAHNHARLVEHYRNLVKKLKALEGWHNNIQLGLAETRIFPSVWDSKSPRLQYPDLLNAATDEEQISTVQSLREIVKEMISSEREDQSAVEGSRRKMSSAFERLQVDLRSDAYKQHLPAVIDELRRHDAESIGSQGRELVQRCEEIARNIESDLEISQRIVDNLVDMLLQRSREYHQKLQTASQITLPEDVFIYGGNPILRAGIRLDFSKHWDVFRQSVENWLYELMQQNRLPEVNPRAGNCLGSELLYQLLGASSGKKEFNIRLLKCDDTGGNYEPVGKDLGSGGEALTTAVLLYSLLISMRKKRRNQSDNRIPAFLILDNPLGVCNRSDFLDAQLKVARAMGIQCVYLTGINDRESLDLFELRVAIRKADKKLEIDGITYDCLEITELNVEKRHGSNVA